LEKKLVSFCIPVLNESDNLDRLFSQLEEFALLESDYDFEFFFTDNQSTDDSWSMIEVKGKSDKRYRGIRFTRNIGFNNSIFVNLQHAKGDALVQYDADLQDPISLVSEFLRSWEQGYKVVAGLRTRREENLLSRQFRRVGYRIITRATGGRLLSDVGDFKLLDRHVVNRLITMRSPTPYLRGIISEFNYPTALIPYGRFHRIHGKTKFSLPALMSMGANALFEHSRWAMRFIWVLFALSSVLVFGLSMVYLWQGLFHEEWPQGLLTMYLLQLFTLWFITFGFALLFTYVIRVYVIVTRTPRFNIETSLNI